MIRHIFYQKLIFEYSIQLFDIELLIKRFTGGCVVALYVGTQKYGLFSITQKEVESQYWFC